MPRHARIDTPGLLQHVIVRGIERGRIFLDDQDRDVFLSKLTSILQDSHTDCYAWALLENHFHLLLRPHTQKLATVMRRLLTGYAVTFNHRHNRSGHLFQNRYKSLVCDEDPYFLELIRYIHLNPLRANMVASLEELERFPWSGHSELLGPASRTIIKTKEVLALFAPRPSSARSLYRSFLEDGCPAVKLSCGGKKVSRSLDASLAEDLRFDERILGGGAFVEQILRGANEAPGGCKPSLEELTNVVAEQLKLLPESLSYSSKERLICRARAVVCFLAVRRFGIKGTELANHFNCSSTTISLAAKRGETLLNADLNLRKFLALRWKL